MYEFVFRKNKMTSNQRVAVATGTSSGRQQEFRDLFEKANFKLTRLTMTPTSVAIVEAIPA